MDHHREAMAAGEYHTCEFVPQRSIATFFRDGAPVPGKDASECICSYLATTNTPISTGESPVLRGLLRDLYTHGFHPEATNPRANVDDEFDSYCPPLKATAI